MSINNSFDVIVVGGGPAGIIAAGKAAELKQKTLLVEKMPSLGRKLLITGKGRCNITNSASIKEFISVVKPNGRFLKHAFSRFYADDIIALLHEQNVNTILERGGRYFPESGKSLDVLKGLTRWMNQRAPQLRLNAKFNDLIVQDNRIKGVIVNDQKIYANNVILATGGKSYPATGSDGKVFDIISKYGHKIQPLRPSLVGLETKGKIAQQLQGLNLKNVKAVVWVDGRKMDEDFGEMLYTHYGLSGPIILSLSRIVVEALDRRSKVEIHVDLKPALDEQKLDKRLLRDINEHRKKSVENIFKFWLPLSMINVFIDQLNIDPKKPAHQISSQERKKIKYLLKNFPFEISNHRPFDEAIITAGGVSLEEVSPKTMGSKIISGLFFAGEILDLDAKTGGYNLQIAYSTAYLAGESASNIH